MFKVVSSALILTHIESEGKDQGWTGLVFISVQGF